MPLPQTCYNRFRSITRYLCFRHFGVERCWQHDVLRALVLWCLPLEPLSLE